MLVNDFSEGKKMRAFPYQRFKTRTAWRRGRAIDVAPYRVHDLKYGQACLRERGARSGAWAANSLFGLGKRSSAGFVLDPLVRDIDSAQVREDANASGRSMFTLFIGGDLHWIIAVPGTGIPGQERCSSPWHWRIQNYRSRRQTETDLSTVTELLPTMEDRARDLHGEVIRDLTERLASGEAEIEVHIERLEREFRDAQVVAEASEETGEKRDHWRDRSLSGFQPVRVSWKPALGMAAESGEKLKAGDEREGRFLAVLSPRCRGAWEAVEVEVDVKRSLVTLHAVDGQASIAVRGESIGGKLSIPVSDREASENPLSLRLGCQLSKELERVVSVG